VIQLWIRDCFNELLGIQKMISQQNKSSPEDLSKIFEPIVAKLMAISWKNKGKYGALV